MLKKRWAIKKVKDEFAVEALADSLNISQILSGLLVLRDIKTYSQAKRFFQPSLDSLHDPYLMNGMDDATYRLIKALTENELITIYGDYDVDGTCATALLYLFLKELDANVEYYIPKRLTEGYGISKQGIDQLKSRGTSLLISVDCGITAIDETKYANEIGLDVIICDHHQPKKEIPDALAVLDPLKPNCNYPFKYLSGAGIAFKLAQGLADRIGKREMPLQYLDLAALAGAADIVPLTNENRVIVYEGLKLINETPRPAIEALLEMSRLMPGTLNSGQIVFTLAPRINAVGRMGDANRAVELMITKNKEDAIKLAQVLETENYERRKIDVDTFDAAMELVESSLDLDNDLAIVLHQDKWHPGVIGIVASRLVEKYYRPTVMLTTIDGVAKGSARSISNFNIYEALQQCEDSLIHFGGHQAAAGLALEVNKIEEFKEKFNEVVRSSVTEEDLCPEISVDARVKFSEITPKFIRILDRFAPFGPGNMRPVFISENISVVNTPRIVGNNHLVCTVKQEGCEKVFDCIGFNLGEFYDILMEEKNNLKFAYTIDKTVRDGRTYPQFRIKDIKTNENSQETA
ncbi:single-stranded-DNA-specific exonuclease RecJ [bacterium BMS3Abin03]|nr:single-stranded-DNA-specific exonuclease RecJ [bacterium BMS3Abin03]HDZ58824.1 single-stranded-DNA-specific exonuclease RecJ [Ignavibacteriales bacterium]